MRRRIVLGLVALLVLLALLVVGACGRPQTAGAPRDEPPAEAPYLTGGVTELQVAASETTVGSLLVEGRGAALSASVTTTTAILRATGDSYERVAFDALARGQRVAVWVDGPVAESFPAQGQAAAIVIDP